MQQDRSDESKKSKDKNDSSDSGAVAGFQGFGYEIRLTQQAAGGCGEGENLDKSNSFVQRSFVQTFSIFWHEVFRFRGK